MHTDFYITRLSNDMKIAVQKNQLGGQILYKSLAPPKKPRHGDLEGKLRKCELEYFLIIFNLQSLISRDDVIFGTWDQLFRTLRYKLPLIPFFVGNLLDFVLNRKFIIERIFARILYEI
mgnify:CR=1 FL=1